MREQFLPKLETQERVETRLHLSKDPFPSDTHHGIVTRRTVKWQDVFFYLNLIYQHLSTALALGKGCLRPWFGFLTAENAESAEVLYWQQVTGIAECGSWIVDCGSGLLPHRTRSCG